MPVDPERIHQVPDASPEQVEAALAARPVDVPEARRRNREEYSHFVAAGPIYIGTARGYNAGDVVGKDVVTRRGAPVDRAQVIEYGSKAHNELRERQGLPPVED
jgi:hypothetical protein